ncbi:hypothetical protein C8F01DRAFT_1363484 [Mycena amicta]|nr:hypothetical protein C8F01DRAFT_1363484 [Mycena amicta]
MAAAPTPSSPSEPSWSCAAIMGWGPILLLYTDPDTMVYALNSDVVGYGVRVGTFITGLCTAIVAVLGTEKELQSAFDTMMCQTGIILLSATVALANGQLSILDAFFILIATNSPMVWYSVLPLPFRRRNRRWRWRLRFCLRATIVFGWFSLHLFLVVKLWDGTYAYRHKDSLVCTFSAPAFAVAALLSALFPGGSPFDMLMSLGASFLAGVLTYASHEGLVEPAKYQPSKLGWKGRFRLGRRIMATRGRKCIILVFTIPCHLVWVIRLHLRSVEPGWIPSYGQVLTIIVAVVNLWFVIKLVFRFLRGLAIPSTRDGVNKMLEELLMAVSTPLPSAFSASFNEDFFDNRLKLPAPTDLELLQEILSSEGSASYDNSNATLPLHDHNATAVGPATSTLTSKGTTLNHITNLLARWKTPPPREIPREIPESLQPLIELSTLPPATPTASSLEEETAVSAVVPSGSSTNRGQLNAGVTVSDTRARRRYDAAAFNRITYLPPVNPPA